MKYSVIELICFTFITILLSSCQEDSIKPEHELGNGYIKGNFDSEFLNFSQPYYTTELPLDEPDVFFSSFNPNQNEGQFTLGRNDAINFTRGIQIGIIGINLDKMPVPIEFSKQQTHPNFAYASIQLRDFTRPDTLYGPNDAYNYIGTTDEDMKLRVISKSNDILKGTFEGKIRTRTGLVKEVTNGEFQIKIIRIE